MVEGRFHPSVVAETLPGFLREVIGAARTEDWQAPQREVALTKLKVIRRAKEQNSWKGLSLIIAIAAEVLAVLCLATAVGAILLD